MMASIYRHAGNVIVWLGPESYDSDEAISLLESLSSEYRVEYAQLLDTSDPIVANLWRAMARARMQRSYDELREEAL
jgi:hypothetical protein